MGTKRSTAVVFKPYDPGQISLLPPSLDELIAPNHPVRIVDKVIDEIDTRPITRKYKGGGASGYHPRMLLKVLVCAYLTNVYSSRKLEEQVRRNIHFMWLTGMKTPDHHTINRFRSEKLSGILKEIFSQIVQLLMQEGMVNLKEAVFTDGTKIGSAANRYTFVWGKAIRTSKERIKAQPDELWNYARGVAAEELKDTSSADFESLAPEKVKAAVEKISRAISDKEEASKKVKQKLTCAKKNRPENLERYEQQEKILAGRNSYSRTDPDATFMRMKEDHMLNGQLKPACNLQISTREQFILNYSVHQHPTDTLTLKSHIAQYASLYKLLPAAVVADAGYGSADNYTLPEGMRVAACIKYNTLDREQKKEKNDTKPFLPEKLYYNEQEDCLYCPMGQKMSMIGQIARKTASGFQRTISRYQAINCQGCPLRGQCRRSRENRIVEIDHELIRQKRQTQALLNSEQGMAYRKKRPRDVEPVFANIKSNHGFKRFLLRGLSKTEVEIGLLSIAHNLRKWKA